MALTRVVGYANLHLAKRLDAEHYSPRFAPIHQNLKRNRLVKLRRTLTQPVITGHTPSTKVPAYYEPGTIKFIKTDNLREDRIDISEVNFISEIGNSVIRASELRPDDVIVTIIGATEEIIGRAARIHKDLGRANINQNIALIRSRLPAGYLTIFLNSRYGREQLIWLSRQTGQVNLNCREVEEISIPMFSREFITFIHSLNDKSHALLSQSHIYYKQAEQLLLTELGLADWQPRHTLTFTGSYRATVHARRLDAEHYQPRYAELRERIRNYPHGYCKITDIACPSQEMVSPRETPDQPFQYVELSDINKSIGAIEKANTILGKDAPSRARMALRAGDVIASSVQGSLDKVALVPEHLDGSVGSTGFFVFRPRTVESGYLLALVKSIVVREQMACEAAGTILAAVPTKNLKNIIVPKIPPAKRQEVDDLVHQSHAAQQQAKDLLETAKRAVEIAIEEGEEKAVAFLESNGL